MRTCTAIAALAALAATAHVTAQELVTFHWSFTEVVANSTTPATGPLAGNGLIDPGEAARIALMISFSPPSGSPATYTPPPGTGQGTIGGLASIFFDLTGGAGAEGAWGPITRPGAWAVGSAGTITSSGIVDAMAGQFPLGLGNPSNYISNIWRVVWTPGEYTPRSAPFTASKSSSTLGTGAALYIEYGGDPEDPVYVSKAVAADFGSLQIPVVPSPTTLVIVSAGLLAAARRRR
jgi:hypothetical protein